MATLARRVFKVALFLCLFVLAVCYVRPYPFPMTESQLAVWWCASDWLGIRDPEDLIFEVWVTIELIAATLAYVAIMWLWRHYRQIRRSPTDTA